jgi:hypothetical protein
MNLLRKDRIYVPLQRRLAMPLKSHLPRYYDLTFLSLTQVNHRTFTSKLDLGFADHGKGKIMSLCRQKNSIPGTPAPSILRRQAYFCDFISDLKHDNPL